MPEAPGVQIDGLGLHGPFNRPDACGPLGKLGEPWRFPVPLDRPMTVAIVELVQKLVTSGNCFLPQSIGVVKDRLQLVWVVMRIEHSLGHLLARDSSAAKEPASRASVIEAR